MKFFYLILFCFSFPSVFAQEQISFFFDSNKSDLKKTEIEKLNKWAVSNATVKVVGVYGFCDEVGSVGYNDTLAKKRVDFVYNLIKNKVKIREDFKTRSFGKLHTMSKIQAENRKVTLYYILPKDFAREEEIVKDKQVATVAKPKTKISFPEKLVYDNPDGSKSELKMDTLFMRKVYEGKVGEKLKLENLNFYIDTYAVVPQSRVKMHELLYVMKSNPKLKIQIQGHLCCVSVDVRNLSTLRAKAIYKFLEFNEIDKSRMTFKGFGSTIPLFPLPEKTEAEREANRRVEIEIVENGDN